MAKIPAFLPPLALALALTACAPTPATQGQLRSASDVAANQTLAGTPGAAFPSERWWEVYGDPQLNALVEEALANSPDVAAAAARLRRAEAMAQAAGATNLPTIDAQGGATLDKRSLNNGFPKQFLPRGWQDSGQLALALHFDPDLWGKNRAALAAATSEARAAQYEAAQARTMLVSAVVTAYADFLRLEDERAVRDGIVAARTKSQDLVNKRVRAGLDNMASLRSAEAQTAVARGDRDGLQEMVGLRRNQIAALVGAGPDRGLALTAPHWGGGFAPLPENAATDLIGRRPDVIAARERAEAAAQRIKVARADFYPSIRLDALIGLQALGLDNLFSSDSVMGSVGPAVSLPLFRGGAIKGKFRAAEATYDEAVAGYNRTVLDAYRQVADAVTSRRENSDRLAEARRALAATEAVWSLARSRYSAGLSTYLDVLAVEERLQLARLSVSALEGAVRGADVALIRALGGGYTPAPRSQEPMK